MSASSSTLPSRLERTIHGEVRFDDGSRALYATDASNYRQTPIGVVIPKTVQDVLETVRLCREHGAPLLSRGGGTSLCGQCCNEAVVIDFSKHLNRILEIDQKRKRARVQPGVVLDQLRTQAGKLGLTFAPDPATHDHNTLGGMVGNNSCGPHSVMGGTTVENVLALEVLTYRGERLRIDGGFDGEIAARLRALAERYGEEIRTRFPHIPRRVSGYNLPALLPESGFDVAKALVGSEGTCVTVLEAELRLVDRPPATALAVLGYDDVYAAAQDVPRLMRTGPIALEGIDQGLVQDMRIRGMHTENLKLLPHGHGWLLVEYGGANADEAAEKAAHAARDGACQIFRDPVEQRAVWKVRESGLGATAHPPNAQLTWEGWEDSSVPPERLAEYLHKLHALYEKYGYHGDLYGHFGQGCVHTRINFDLETAAGIEKYRRFVHEAAQLVVSLGGSISGEHGDGQSKAELLETMFGARLMEAFREFKHIWDPDGRMNPGKVVEAYRADQNLRLGRRYAPRPVQVHFHYREDSGDFSRALLRCVGVGECRKREGTMCPSYMATGEEMHSTRGRAHLLWEMLDADTLKHGWKEPAVKEALDLCLSCKGCKKECPVQVDMATYKSEFLAHYYEGRLRPPAAYAFGPIDRWARLGSRLPGTANFLMNTALAKRLVGIAPQREVTRFAAEPFTRRFKTRGEGPEVILWPDTFNNYFHPYVAQAAVETLTAAGCRVRIPPEPLCCGRPLYEFGMLDRAKAYLARVLDVLDDDIRAGTPVVGLEPACLSVFRDELTGLFPFSEQAKRLSAQTFLLSEFLLRAPRLPFRVESDALVHLHCHHKSIFGTGAVSEVMKRAALRVDMPDSGCCGMAGSFGFEREKYEVSMRCAERVIAPAVRAAAPETLVIADGFSCREQIAHATGRRPLHLAQVLAASAGR